MKGRLSNARPDPFAILAFAGAILGLLLAAVSTFDFAQHLDRQVHSIHCSFIPGASGGGGDTGCQTAMMSPYSSVMRTWLWGGVPISLPAMAVFAFLAFFAVDLVVTDRQRDRRATAFFTAAATVPLLASIVMGYLSLVELGATCKLCVGIYAASILGFAGALGLLFRARRGGVRSAAPPRPAAAASKPAEPAWVGKSDAVPETASDPDSEPLLLTDRKSSGLPTPLTLLAAGFGIGVLFVLFAVSSYVVAAPDHSRFVGTCGGLSQPGDPYGVMVDLGGRKASPVAIEILDPLCPACRAFEERLGASGHAGALDRRAVLFPLDNTCNWMVNEAIHPGACAVSEAVLCAGTSATAVIEWAFEHQETIREAAASDPNAAAAMVTARFPELGSCLGKPEVKSRLNKSLRWAVANNIQVLTPQLFIDGVKLCDEDVDLGLEFALAEMLDRRAKGTLKVLGAEAAPEPTPEPEPEPEPTPTPAPEPEPEPAAAAVDAAVAKPTPAVDAGPAPDPLPDSDPEPEPDSDPDSDPEPPKTPPEPTPDPAPAPAPDVDEGGTE